MTSKDTWAWVIRTAIVLSGRIGAKSLIPILLLSTLALSFGACHRAPGHFQKNGTNPSDMKIREIYDRSGLTGKLPFDTFRHAINGTSKFDFESNDVLTIIDYTRPSTAKRLFVIDLHEKKLLFRTYVAHGENSGVNYATKFSNKGGSHQSSPGFYRTAETYEGKHGYSLRLDGLEQGINHKARDRAIVIHGASYVSEEFIEKNGRLGRSWGCPALPVKSASAIIDAIKGGSCLYIHADVESGQPREN